MGRLICSNTGRPARPVLFMKRILSFRSPSSVILWTSVVVSLIVACIRVAGCTTAPSPEIRSHQPPDVLCQVVVQKQVVDTIEGRRFVLYSSRGESLTVGEDEWSATILGEPKCSDEWRKLQ